MITIDFDTAVEMVKQLYPQAKNPMLTIELELTKGSLRYRPYMVAAKFLLTEYRKIVKADEVTFSYSEDAIRGLLNRQLELDAGDVIPDGQKVEDMLSQLCAKCDNTPASNLGIILI
jgi:hypothetical protein